MSDIPLGSVPISTIDNTDHIIIAEGTSTRKVPYLEVKKDIIGSETLTPSATSVIDGINKNTASLSDLTKIPGVIDDTGTVNTYVITLANAPTGYAKYQTFKFIAKTANTGASTLNVNGLGAKALVKDVNVALVTGDILARQIVTAIYDGTNFQISPDFKTQFANKIDKASIVNNLTATVAGSVLDATQGKNLQDEINTINNNLKNVPITDTRGTSKLPSQYTIASVTHEFKNGADLGLSAGYYLLKTSKPWVDETTYTLQEAQSVGGASITIYRRTGIASTWNAWV